MTNVTITGRLTETPEIRKTTSGKLVAQITIASQRDKETADFISCVAWEKTAEFLSRYFQKGSWIAATGSLQQRKFEDKNGNKRTVLEVVIDRVSFVGNKDEQAAKPAEKAKPDVDFVPIEDDAQLPF